MIARINSVQPTADQRAGLLTFAEEQLPVARRAAGFKGFYLLADRGTGNIVSISLWENDDDLRQFEARGTEMREGASEELGIAPTPVDVYEVLLQA